MANTTAQTAEEKAMSAGNASDHSALIARLEAQDSFSHPLLNKAELCVRCEAARVIAEYDSMWKALIAFCDRPSRYTLFGDDRENAGKRAVLIDDIRAIIERGGKVHDE